MNDKELKKYFSDNNFIEIGVYEVGRGPLFGRVYTACVILPRDNNFNYDLLKDSKKFTSKKKLLEAYNYIKENCISCNYSWEDEKVIDSINILSSTHKCMHSSIKELLNKMDIIYNENTKNYKDKYLLLIDGNNFKNYTYFNNENDQLEVINHVNIEGGDNKYCSIAAASIIAKVERDNYIERICNQNNILIDYYDLLNNKGYGTKKHLEGIKNYGITNIHRKSFGICKTTPINHIIKYDEQ